MDWGSVMKGYKAYIKLERGLSLNSSEAYLRDVAKLRDYAISECGGCAPKALDAHQILSFVSWLSKSGLDARSQARTISGIKSFYKFMLLEDLIAEDPTELLETPKLGRYLPDVLSREEIIACLEAVDLSSDFGYRDRAILEILYACGLRVSELTDLRWSRLILDPGLIRVSGKGNKERLVPVGEHALAALEQHKRFTQTQAQFGHEDFIFLNFQGKRLSRVSVFQIVKKYCAKAGIRKTVSPHTFRHSFATHLVEAGAGLRLVQTLLGHESITTTEIYTHLDLDYLRETILNCHPIHKRNRGQSPPSENLQNANDVLIPSAVGT